MAENEQEQEIPQGGGMMGLIKAVVIISVLVIVELVAASMLMPSANKTEQLAEEMARAAKGEDAQIEEEHEQIVANIEGDTVEVELISDNITRFDPEADKTLNVTFTVFGVVLIEEEAEFMTEFEANKNRVSEQIMMTMHGATTTDLTMPGLGLIKRQILEKTNRTLGKPYLNDVIFTKINFIER